jgi:hypothetical protein
MIIGLLEKRHWMSMRHVRWFFRVEWIAGLVSEKSKLIFFFLPKEKNQSFLLSEVPVIRCRIADKSSMSSYLYWFG